MVPVYFFAFLIALSVFGFAITLKETREFIGSGGLEVCWKYMNFNRYVLASIGGNILALAFLVGLYWFAKHNRVRAYLLTWGLWLTLVIAKLLLSDSIFC